MNFNLFKIILFAIILAAPSMAHDDGWRQASRESANLAPSPEDEKNAVIQVYAAATFGWRGFFADHTWISVKPVDANEYTVYEVIGWRLRNNKSVVRAVKDIPDRFWYGNKPRVLLDVRGEKAQRLIPEIEQAVLDYPYPEEYTAFPGPNSNTFIAWISKQVPDLNLDLPLRAVGRSYPTN